MNKCEKCGGIHWRTAPCIQPRVRIGTQASDNALTTPKSDVSASPPRKEVHTQSTAARKDVQRQMAQRAQPEMGTPDCTELASRPQASIRESAAGTQALPVDKSRTRKKALAGEVPSVNEQPETVGKLVQVQQSGPATKFDRKTWMREYQRNYMRNVYRPKLKASKSNPNTPERNDK